MSFFFSNDQLSVEVFHTPRCLYEATLAKGESLIAIGKDGRVDCHFLEITMYLQFIVTHMLFGGWGGGWGGEGGGLFELV